MLELIRSLERLPKTVLAGLMVLAIAAPALRLLGG